MPSRRAILTIGVAGMLWMFGEAPAATAQGVTTAAVSGRIVSQDGQPLGDVQIQVVNQATGATAGALSRSDGRYSVQGLEVGGPYAVTARRVGYAPQSADPIYLALGQNAIVPFTMQPQAAQLTTVDVNAEQSPIFSSSNMAPSTSISDTLLRRLPTLDRNFTDFVVLTPEVSTSGPGLSAGGANNRFNNIQIDGASENDIFGLGSTGEPGGQANGKSISIESVKEYQILLAPYDVRLGNFTGALINAVTKSGTNQWHGSAYEFFRNEKLARNDPFIRTTQFDRHQFGFSVGGPIVKDKVLFFVNPEFQTFTTPARGPFAGAPAGSPQALNVSPDSLARFAHILQGFGIDPGSDAAVSNQNPVQNVFARMDVPEIFGNSRLVVRYNYGSADDDAFSRSARTFEFTSHAHQFRHTKNAPVAQLFTNFKNGSFNEFIAGYNRIRDRRTPGVIAPQVTVPVTNLTGGTTNLVAGGEEFSQGNELDQDVTELTDNFTIPMGSHRVTIGTHNEFYHIRNLFAQASFGVYSFQSLDSLAAGIPSTYRIGLDLGAGITAEFNAAQYGVYVEDAWQPTPDFTLTYGLRADIPVMNDRPPASQFVQDNFARSTSTVPSGQVQWSPRVGFNWDVGGAKQMQVRGGAGVFQGRPAFVWVGNAFANNGRRLGTLNCGRSFDPGDAPMFSPDPASQSPGCVDRTTGETVGDGSFAEVDLLQKDLKFPQTFRASLAVDRSLGRGWVATVDGLYTHAINEFFVQNLNLTGPVGQDRNGRVMYGTVGTTGRSQPELNVSTLTNGVINVGNESKSYAYDVTGQLQKRFADRFAVKASYTYARTYSVQDLTSSRAISNWRFGRELSGSHASTDVGTSLFDMPHKVLITGTYTFPWDRYATDLSLIYDGHSGQAFTYVYSGSSGRGDLNANGDVGNDLIYVPKSVDDQNEIMFDDAESAAAFEKFIENSDCLSAHRGSILPRGACRTPWQNVLDLSVRQSVPGMNGHAVSFQLDVFNVLNLINRSWGKIELNPSGFTNESLLRHVGETAGDVSTAQGVFTFDPGTEKFRSDNIASFYQIQLSARYSF